jgi:hypothetical protein
MCRTSVILVMALWFALSSSAEAKSSASPGEAEPKKAEPAKAAPRAAEAKKSKKKKVDAPRFAPSVHVVRRRGDQIETRDLALTFCDGAPNPSAVDSVSVLARPRDVERPFMPEIKAYQRLPLAASTARASKAAAKKRRKPDYLSEHVMRVHPGLLVRLQKIATRFPGKTIEIVSGHRPDARDTSRHHHGRALDVHVQGVTREKLRDFLRTLDETGVGYYPNGYFVHVDVRDDRGYWVDRSGPGEAADYGPWPPPQRDIDDTRRNVIAQAVAELGALEQDLTRPSEAALEEARGRLDAPVTAEEPEAPSHAEEAIGADEVARIKAEALKALESL